MYTKNQKQKRPVVGALFKDGAKEENALCPDILGRIALPSDLLRYLTKQHQEGADLAIQLAGWRNQSSTGKWYYAMVASEPYNKQPRHSVGGDGAEEANLLDLL